LQVIKAQLYTYSSNAYRPVHCPVIDSCPTDNLHSAHNNQILTRKYALQGTDTTEVEYSGLYPK